MCAAQRGPVSRSSRSVSFRRSPLRPFRGPPQHNVMHRLGRRCRITIPGASAGRSAQENNVRCCFNPLEVLAPDPHSVLGACLLPHNAVPVTPERRGIRGTHRETVPCASTPPSTTGPSGESSGSASTGTARSTSLTMPCSPSASQLERQSTPETTGRNDRGTAPGVGRPGTALLVGRSSQPVVGICIIVPMD